MPDAFARWFDAHEAALDAEIAADTRRDLLLRARDRLERVTWHDRWDCSARNYAAQAAALLRDAGMDALAADCEDEFGCDAAAVLRDLDKETGHG